jgi:hypothetical protein
MVRSTGQGTASLLVPQPISLQEQGNNGTKPALSIADSGPRVSFSQPDAFHGQSWF